MNIEVAGLTGKKLTVGTPMYAGGCTGFYLQGMMSLASLCAQYDIPFQTIIVADSLVTRARNRVVDIFKSMNDNPDDVLMFIDSDIQFSAPDVFRLMMQDKDMVGALYPLKHINWKRVSNIVKNNPTFAPDDLAKAASDYVFNLKLEPGQQNGKIEIGEPVKVLDIGTGFVMIKRKVFDAIEESGIAKSYIPCHNEETFSGPRIYDHFPCGIDSELDIGKEDIYLSEDWVFCRRWQKLGGDVWACPWIRLSHFGTMGFQGDLTALANSGQKLGEEVPTCQAL